MPALVVYGDALVDITVRIDNLPQTGGDAIIDDLQILPGGSAGNCAAIAARLGVEVKFVGLTGRDSFGQLLRRDLEAHGVDVAALRLGGGSTGATITLLDRDGEPTYLSFRGVTASMPYGPLPDGLPGPGDTLHVSGYSFQTPDSRHTAHALMAAAREVGAAVSLDPSHHFARQVMENYPDALGGLAFLFPNRDEARLMTGLQDPAQAARRLCEIGVQMVLLKMGADGCLLATEGSVTSVPAYPAQVVGATGAGDAFSAGFLAAAMSGCAPEDAARVGHAAAARVIGEVGGHTAAPTLAELERFAAARNDPLLGAALKTVLSAL